MDCTARVLSQNVNSRPPVVSPERISLQMMGPLQQTFSAALIGHFEATVADEADKEKWTRVVPMTDTVEDWARMVVSSMSNQFGRMSNEGLAAWVAGCRLDLFGRMVQAQGK